MLVATEQSKLGGVRLKAVHQLVRAAQRGMPAPISSGVMPRRSRGGAAEETSGEQAVIAADQDPRGDIEPGRP